MKPSGFKIRSMRSDQFNYSQNDVREREMMENSHQDEVLNGETQYQMNNFFKMFQQFFNKNEKVEQAVQLANKYDLEVRDREVIVQTPPIINKKISKIQLKKWTAKVMRNVSSAAFHYFQNNQMTFEQAKVYSSENILKNIVILGQSVTLTDKDFETMDKHIKKKVLDYLSAKYPMTDSAEANKKLEATVRQVDNIESLQNNYFANTDLIFQYRDDGNYNDLIMRMMNEIMELVDGQSEEKTNYEDFRQFMANLFEKVEDQDWVKSQGEQQMGKKSKRTTQTQIFEQEKLVLAKDRKEVEANKQKSSKRSEQKEKYGSKVREYTKYMIGRKISQDTPCYNEKEIKRMSMAIKSPAVLRILTKWCEQLMDKFETPNYYSNRSENIKVQRGDNVHSLFSWMRKQLNQYLQEERDDIRKCMKELFQNNYQMHQNLLKYEIDRKDQGEDHIDQFQKISGKFSLKTVQSLHSYIISLLNRLIHGLMKVAKRVYDNKGLAQFPNWPSPLNLLTFKVGDLMRCKCSSHQKQILHIYKELQRLSREEPQKLRIVRIKNRLRTGTNDVLINVKFNDKVMCEIQLAVKVTTSNFIKCSNDFHHYFYELQRSYFGPLTELCSIWSCLDRRRQIYQQLINAQDQRIEQNEHTCAKLNQPYQMVQYQRSFICGQCSRTYFHNNFYLHSHSRCSRCGFFVCAKCQLSQESQQQLIAALIVDPKLRNLCVKRITETEPLPQLGVCVFMQSQPPKAEIFTHFISQKNGKQYILSKADRKIYQIESICNKKQQLSFRNNYIVWKLKPNEDFAIIDKEQIHKRYLLPTLIKEDYQKQKQTIYLMDEKLNNQDCRRILDVGTQWQKGRVKNLYLADQQLTQIPFNPDQFHNLNWLTFNRNPLINCEGLDRCTNLSIFVATKCNFKQVPTAILGLKHIVKLCLSSNSISKIPISIANLAELTTLELDNNNLQQLPQELCLCLSLKILNVGNNRLKTLPQIINKLQNLTIFICNSNRLTILPMRIGELKCLKDFNSSDNQFLKSLPNSLYNLNNLEKINCSFTKIGFISENIRNLSNLRTLDLKNCQNITVLPSSFVELQKLESIDFSQCKGLELFENIGQLANLKHIHLVNCGLNSLPESFNQLKFLETLDLSKNRLSRMSTQIFTGFQLLLQLKIWWSGLEKFPNLSKCKKLIKINFNENQITEIPNEYMKGLINIEQVKINSNQLSYFPLSILDFSGLRILQATSNRLHSIVREKDLQDRKLNLNYLAWSKLRSVNLFHNKFVKFPIILLNCRNLEQLCISNNKITNIPAKIGILVKLKTLNLNYNEIIQIPKQMSQMNSLQKIMLTNNKIEKIPKQLQQIIRLNTLNLDKNPICSYQNLEWIINNKIQCGPLEQRINTFMLASNMKNQQTNENNKLQMGNSKRKKIKQ